MIALASRRNQEFSNDMLRREHLACGILHVLGILEMLRGPLWAARCL